jgi:hypothetical protein
MGSRFKFDDCDDEELWEEDEQKARGKNLRQRREHKKDLKRDATWAFERDTRER